MKVTSAKQAEWDENDRASPDHYSADLWKTAGRINDSTCQVWSTSYTLTPSRSLIPTLSKPYIFMYFPIQTIPLYFPFNVMQDPPPPPPPPGLPFYEANCLTKEWSWLPQQRTWSQGVPFWWSSGRAPQCRCRYCTGLVWRSCPGSTLRALMCRTATQPLTPPGHATNTKTCTNWHAHTWYSGTSFIMVDWVLKTNYLSITNPVLLVVLLNVPEDLSVQAHHSTSCRISVNSHSKLENISFVIFFQLSCTMKISSL